MSVICSAWRTAEAALPAGLWLTGSAYRGLAVPDCIQQGRESARQALQVLSLQRHPLTAPVD